MRHRARILIILALPTLLGPSAAADIATIAVASNFATAMRELGARFEADTKHGVRVSTASTGKLYAQIVNGAPFDVLLAADAERPRRLEVAGSIVPGSRFTYAIGRLVLWSRHPDLSRDRCRAALERDDLGHVAIANPETAPYGAAARETLIALGIWDRIVPRLVIGENIGQTLQFVATGNASLGFIAAAQLRAEALPEASCTWEVPPDLHRPIEQQAVLLNRAAGNPAAGGFVDFLRSETGRAIVARHGYLLPDEN